MVKFFLNPFGLRKFKRELKIYVNGGFFCKCKLFDYKCKFNADGKNLSDMNRYKLSSNFRDCVVYTGHFQ